MTREKVVFLFHLVEPVVVPLLRVQHSPVV
jgi:hypothetical protein